MTANKNPDFLQSGDTIAIAASARKVKYEEISFAIQYLENQGFKVVLAENLFADYHQFAGTDIQRTDSWNALFQNPNIKAILCARGGYGTSRMIDFLDWDAFKQNPKWVIGFSDVTVLLAKIFSLGFCAIHAPMAFNFEQAQPTILTHLLDVLTGKSPAIKNPPQEFDIEGVAKGKLIGGNLTLLAHLIGSKRNFLYQDSILFIEDIGEYYYNLDRMWHQLQNAAYIKNIKGLIVGGFTDLQDHAIPFGLSLQEIFLSQIPSYIPVAWNFPVSHTENNYPLITGAEVELKVGNNGTILQYLQ